MFKSSILEEGRREWYKLKYGNRTVDVGELVGIVMRG